jgi:phage terminase small subunit
MPNEIDRQAIERDYNTGMKYKELAEKYGVAISTVKSWKTRYKWDRSVQKDAYKKQKSTRTKKDVRTQGKTTEEQPIDNEVDTLNITDKQRRFADEYLIDLNATQAAIRAGYSPRTAQQQSSDLLLKLVIRDYIDQRLAEQSARTGINSERILREYARMGFARVPDIVDTTTGKVKENLSPDDAAAISSIKIKTFESDNGFSTECEVKIHDKQKALQRLEKYQGLTKQEDEHLQLEQQKLEFAKAQAAKQDEPPTSQDLSSLMNALTPQQPLENIFEKLGGEPDAEK